MNHNNNDEKIIMQTYNSMLKLNLTNNDVKLMNSYYFRINDKKKLIEIRDSFKDNNAQIDR